MPYPITQHPYIPLRMLPNDPYGLRGLYHQYNNACVVEYCNNPLCRGYGHMLPILENPRYVDGVASCCVFCKTWHDIRPPIFRGLHGLYADYSDALHMFLNESSLKTIAKNIQN